MSVRKRSTAWRSGVTKHQLTLPINFYKDNNFVFHRRPTAEQAVDSSSN